MSNLCLYRINGLEYIVKILEEIEGKFKIKFIGRVDGGRGRIPKSKLVSKDKLIILTDAHLGS